MLKSQFGSRRIWVVTCAVILAGSLQAGTAEARYQFKNNCNQGQLTSPQGQRCAAKADAAIASYKKYTYVLICGGNGMHLCCKLSDTTGKVSECQSARTTTVGDNATNPDGVLDPGPKKRRDTIFTGGGILDPGLGGGTQGGPSATGAPASGGVAPPRARGSQIN